MSIETKKIGKWNAIVFTDEDGTSISYNGMGGAIISNKNKNIVDFSWLNPFNKICYTCKNS